MHQLLSSLSLASVLSLLLLSLLLPLLSLPLLPPLLGSLGPAPLAIFRGFRCFCGVTGAALWPFVGFFFCFVLAVWSAAASDAALLGFVFCPSSVVATFFSPSWSWFHSCSAIAFTRGVFLSRVAPTARMLMSVPLFAQQQAVATQKQNDRKAGM